MANLAGTCGLGLPLAIFLGLFTSLGQYGVFYAKGADEITKFIFFFLRYQTPAWQGQDGMVADITRLFFVGAIGLRQIAVSSNVCLL